MWHIHTLISIMCIAGQHCPDAIWQTCVALIGQPESEDARAPGLLDRFRALCPRIRDEGLSYTESAMINGIIGISAPIFGADGRIGATLTALGLLSDDRMRHDGPVARGLRAAAQGISHGMGARPGPT
jgi:DNA-binding IclR family transcriptional regulator